MSDIYIYAKSGHKIGLDRVRRCSVLYKTLEKKYPNNDIILTTSDYKAATYAKNILGVKKSVGVDIVQNLPNIMERGDILYYDTDEVNKNLKEGIKEFCSEVYEIGIDIDNEFIDEEFNNSNSSCNRELGFFFGDDDYNKYIFKYLDIINNNRLDILWGLYFFIDYEDKLKRYCNNIIDEDNYFDFIKTTKNLITSSLQSAIESKVAGNKPYLLKREDKDYDKNLIKKYDIMEYR